MPRRLFSLSCALSLLLSAAAVALWVRSYWVSDPFAWTTARVFYCGNVGRGRIWVAAEKEPGTPSFYHESVRPAQLILTPPGPVGKFGFFYDGRRSSVGSARFSLVFPIWLPAVASTFLPGVWVAGFVRRRRRKITGQCLRCGYDLRATPDRCPECGWISFLPRPATNAS